MAVRYRLTMSDDADLGVADDVDDNWLYGDSENNGAAQGDQNEGKHATRSPRTGNEADDAANADSSQPV